MNRKENGMLPKPLHLFMRWIIRLAGCVALLLLMTLIFWRSGILPYRLLPFVVEQATGIRVSFWMEGFRPLYLRNLKVCSAVAPSSMPPLFQADVVRLDWLPRFPDLRGPLFSFAHFSEVQLCLEKDQAGNTNYAFLSEDTESDGDAAVPLSLLSTDIQISGLALQARSPEGAARIDDLDITFSMVSADHFSAALGGATITAGWREGATTTWKHVSESRANITLLRAGPQVHVEADTELSGVLSAKGNASFDIAATPSFDLQIDYVQAEGSFFNALISPLLPLPLSFSLLQVSPSRLRGSWPDSGVIVSESRLEARAEDLRIGTADSPWYEGPVSITATGGYENAARVLFEAVLNQDQRLSGRLEQTGNRVTLRAGFDDWNREQVLALWPVPLNSWTIYLNQLRRVSGSLTCRLSEDRVNLECELLPVFETSLQPQVTASVLYASDTGVTVSGNYTLDTGAVRLASTYTPDSGFSITATAEELPVLALTTLLPITKPPEVAMWLDGSFELEAEPGESARFSVSCSSEKAQAGQWHLPASLLPIVLKLQGGIPTDVSRIALDTGVLTLGESVSCTLSDAAYTTSDGMFRGELAASGSVEPLAAIAGIEEAWGAFIAEGKVTVDPALQVHFNPASFFFETLGYGDVALPYGQTLTVSANAEVTSGDLSTYLENIYASLGTGTSLTAEEVRLSPEWSISSGKALFKTDFNPLVAKGYLASATGTLEAGLEEFYVDGNGIAGTLAYVCSVPHLVLPDDMAALSGITLQGRTLLRPPRSGQGNVSVAAIRAAGTEVVDLQGTIHPRDDIIAVEEITFVLYGGTVDTRVELGPLKPGFSATVSGAVSHLDLDLFTKEFQPGEVALTGLVEGTLTFGVENAHLAALDAEMVSTENFSMDRDTVEQLLMRQYLGDMRGGKQMQRVVQSVIGKDKQRKFDSATAKMGLEEGRIKGNVKCFSDALNLDVDIAADVGALLEALRLRQKPAP